jgi:hypothetical protein
MEDVVNTIALAGDKHWVDFEQLSCPQRTHCLLRGLEWESESGALSLVADALANCMGGAVSAVD